MLCAKFGWIWPSGSGEEDENVKSLRQQQQQQQRRRRRQRTNFDQKSSLELKIASHPSQIIFGNAWTCLHWLMIYL